MRPVLLFALLLAALGWGLSQRLPFLKPLWQRLGPVTAERVGDEGTAAVTDPAPSPGGDAAQPPPAADPATATATTSGSPTAEAATGEPAASASTGSPEPTATLPADPAPADPVQATVDPSTSSSEPGATDDPEAAEAGVRRAVRAWQQAWSQQDPEAYLAIYAPDFRPENGASHGAWADSRRVRLRAPSRIRIGVDNLQVRMKSADQAEAWFFQTFETDQMVRVTWKQLDLFREGTRWLIRREQVRQGPPS